jgi:hypothetical protein
MSESDSSAGWVTTEQAQQMAAEAAQQAVQQALQQHASAAAPASSTGSISAEQAQAMIDQALARQAEAHNKAIADLSASLRGSVQTFIAHNGGGLGTEIAETWSAFEQAAANKADQDARDEAAKPKEDVLAPAAYTSPQSLGGVPLFPSVHG